MQVKRLLIIPAKSNSQRIKNKNFKNFFGKPILLYSYYAAFKSKIFKKIHISTESNIVKKRLKKNGINIDFLRPKKLCKNNVGLFEVYKFVFDEYKKQGLFYDEIWTLLPCSPLINYLDLLKLKKDIENKRITKPLISVSEYNAPIEWAFRLNKKKILTPLNKKKQIVPSQKLKKAYYDTGAISVFNASNLNTSSKFYNGSFYGYILPPEKSVDIDDKHDWILAEKLFNNHKA